MSQMSGYTPEAMMQAIRLNNQRTGRATPYDNPGPVQPGQEMQFGAQPGPGGGPAIVPPVEGSPAAPGVSQPAPMRMPAQGATWNAIGPGYTEGIGVNGQLLRTPAKEGDQNVQTVTPGGIAGGPGPWQGGQMQPVAGPGQAQGQGDPLQGFRQFMAAQQAGPYAQFNPDWRANALRQYGTLDAIQTGNAKLDLERQQLQQTGELERQRQALQERLGFGSQGIQQQELGLKRDIFNEGKSDLGFATDLQGKNPGLGAEQIAAAVDARRQAIGLMGAGQPGAIGLSGGAPASADPKFGGGAVALAPAAGGGADRALMQLRAAGGPDLTNQLAGQQDWRKAFDVLHSQLGDAGVQAHQVAIRNYLNQKAGSDVAIRSALTPNLATKMLDPHNYTGGSFGSPSSRTLSDNITSLFNPSSLELQRNDLLRRLYGMGGR